MLIVYIPIFVIIIYFIYKIYGLPKKRSKYEIEAGSVLTKKVHTGQTSYHDRYKLYKVLDVHNDKSNPSVVLASIDDQTGVIEREFVQLKEVHETYNLFHIKVYEKLSVFTQMNVDIQG